MGVDPSSFTRCKVFDTSLCNNIVEKAPVNQRDWVLQERLPVPRVLHFYRNQIAWKCTEFEHKEAQFEPRTAIISSWGVPPGDEPLKNLTAEAGRLMRKKRLGRASDSDAKLHHLYIFGLWKRDSELYSKIQLTVSTDKLIALAAIAEMFHEELYFSDPGCSYIAGLWAQ